MRGNGYSRLVRLFLAFLLRSEHASKYELGAILGVAAEAADESVTANNPAATA